MIPETFGERLSRLRNRLRLSQDDLAQQVGTWDTTISSWESDRSRPRSKWRPLLADVLGVTEVYLRTGADAVALPPPPPPIRQGARWENQPAADVNLFRRMWTCGVATRRIATRLGIDRTTVWEVRKRLGLPARPLDISIHGAFASTAKDPVP